MKKTQSFKPWTEKVVPFVFDKELSYFDLMVPTQDSTKYSYAMNHLVAIEKAVFFTGTSGIGKTSIIANQLSDQKEKGLIVPININMSAQTTSLGTQSSIDEKLEKKSRTRYGAPPQKKIVVFVDDINMPAVEEYGA
jgi:dynein heavy chain